MNGKPPGKLKILQLNRRVFMIARAEIIGHKKRYGPAEHPVVQPAPAACAVVNFKMRESAFQLVQHLVKPVDVFDFRNSPALLAVMIFPIPQGLIIKINPQIAHMTIHNKFCQRFHNIMSGILIPKIQHQAVRSTCSLVAGLRIEGKLGTDKIIPMLNHNGKPGYRPFRFKPQQKLHAGLRHASPNFFHPVRIQLPQRLPCPHIIIPAVAELQLRYLLPGSEPPRVHPIYIRINAALFDYPDCPFMVIPSGPSPCGNAYGRNRKFPVCFWRLFQKKSPKTVIGGLQIHSLPGKSQHMGKTKRLFGAYPEACSVHAALKLYLRHSFYRIPCYGHLPLPAPAYCQNHPAFRRCLQIKIRHASGG